MFALYSLCNATELKWDFSSVGLGDWVQFISVTIVHGLRLVAADKCCCVACREAIEHFVAALNLQRNSRGPLAGQRAVMSDNIWTTLRITVALLGRTDDLSAACDAHDLDRLNREFHTE